MLDEKTKLKIEKQEDGWVLSMEGERFDQYYILTVLNSGEVYLHSCIGSETGLALDEGGRVRTRHFFKTST